MNKIEPGLLAFLLQCGYDNIREIPGQGVCCTTRMVFTHALLVGNTLDGYKGRYCYENKIEAILAAVGWDGQGDPPGNWIKYKGEGGERTNPNRL